MHVINSNQAAKYLLSEEIRRFLVPFLNHGVDIESAARSLGKPEKYMRNRIKKLVDLGIIVETAEKPKKGRSRKLYQASADDFKIPFQLSPYESLADMMFEMSLFKDICEYYEVIFKETFIGEWFIRVYLDADENKNLMSFTFENSEPPRTKIERVGMVWSGKYLALDFQTAKDLRDEIKDLMKRYTEKSEELEGQQKYFFQIHLVPVPHDA